MPASIFVDVTGATRAITNKRKMQVRLNASMRSMIGRVQAHFNRITKRDPKHNIKRPRMRRLKGRWKAFWRTNTFTLQHPGGMRAVWMVYPTKGGTIIRPKKKGIKWLRFYHPGMQEQRKKSTIRANQPGNETIQRGIKQYERLLQRRIRRVIEHG